MTTWHEEYRDALGMADYSPPNCALVIFRDPAPDPADRWPDVPAPRMDVWLPVAACAWGLGGVMMLLLIRWWRGW